MKNITEFINEKLEINNITGNYCTVTLIKHENIKINELSPEKFEDMIMSDFIKAQNAYKTDVVDVLNNKKEKEWADSLEERLKMVSERARKDAEKRGLKTERGIQKAIDKACENEKNRKYKSWKDDISFFDLTNIKTDIGKTVLRLDNKYILKNWFEDKGNDPSRFNKITGWAFKYEGNKETLRSALRPYIDWIFSDESVSKELKDEKEHLGNAISQYYKGSNYWGD